MTYPFMFNSIILHNVEIQNVEWIKGRIRERRKLHNVENYRTSKYEMSKTTERRNTKHWKKKRRKWRALLDYIYENHLFLYTLQLTELYRFYCHCGPLPSIPNLT